MDKPMIKTSSFQLSKPISRLIKTGVLGEADVRAVIDIECAVISILNNSIHSDGHDVAQGPGAGRAFMRHFEARHSYYGWMGAMQASGLASGPVLDAILEGRPLHEIDKAWRRRKGWTRSLLLKSLRLYRDVSRERATIRLTA